MNFTAWGAAGTVTGTCHLLEHEGYRLLLDCGAFQGEDEERNAGDFGFEPAAIGAVVITHAHFDHIGRLPFLVKRGYQGKVFLTPATARILPFILEDAAHVQQSHFERARRKGHRAEEPVWDEADLAALGKRLVTLPTYQRREIGPFRVELKNAGHLPGSVFVIVEAGGKRLVFSGDVGNRRKDVLPAPDYPPSADLLVCESTYGDRPHRSFQATLEEFDAVLRQTLERGGKVLIPSFALERAQEFLFHIRDAEREGRVPEAPVILDSPLAIRITAAFGELADDFGVEVRTLMDKGIDPFKPRKFRATVTADESKSINELDGPAIIIAGSGMLSGGRILYHLREHLPDTKSVVLIAGYQPRGGLGRLLIDNHGKEVRIHGRDVMVRARVHTLGGFSGHAGQDELLDFAAEQKRVLLVHGEAGPMETLRTKLAERGQDARPARFGETVEV